MDKIVTQTGRIQERLQHSYKEKVDTLSAILEATAPKIEDFSPSLVKEMGYVSKLFQDRLTTFFLSIETFEAIPVQSIDKLLEFMPPDRVFLRYDLDRLSGAYEEICFSFTDEGIKTFKVAESACDRGDYETGMNILQQITAKDKRHFPAHLVYGYGLIVHREEYSEAVRILEQAYQIIRHDQAVHFRTLILELIVKAHELGKNYASAYRTSKRLFTLDVKSPSVHYLTARNYILNDQPKEAMHALETSCSGNPEYLAVAMIDDGFRKLREDIKKMYVELDNEWFENARNLFEKIEDVSRIVRIYGLEETEENIKQDIQNLENLQELIQSDSCLSLNREIVLSKMRKIVPAYPDAVIDGLEDLASERRYDISDYNQYVAEQLALVQGKMRRIALMVWSSISVLTILILMLTGVPFILAFLSLLAASPVGFITYVALAQHMESKYQLQKVGIDAVKQVRAHQRDISWLKSHLVGRVSREGWI
ncbi:tetratricopeptide repeat protein [Calditrichota bacterium]